MQEETKVIPLYGFSTVTETNSQYEVNQERKKRANGVHKYLKKYLFAYKWQDRESIIKIYAKATNIQETKLKDICLEIQKDFTQFIQFLKDNYKPYRSFKNKQNGRKGY